MRGPVDVPPWLIYKWRESWPPHKTVYRAADLACNPMPTVTTLGVANAGQAQFWIADELPAGAVVTKATSSATFGKPPYRIPLVKEVVQVPWCGLNVISAFAGAGGSSTGYRMSGYRVLAAIEFVPAAVASYKANAASYTKVLQRDVREITGGELLKVTGLARGELDVFDGSPPCEPFSTAGRREATWGTEREYSGQRQRTDDLFFEYARLVEELSPRCFVAENVTGLVKGRAKGYFKRIMVRLRECGYRVEARVLDAAWLGVPQSRQRVIFIGVRDDLGMDPVFPAPLGYQYTVRDALPHITRVGTDPNFDRRRAGLTEDEMMVNSDRPSPAVMAGGSVKGSKGLVEELPGGEVRMGSFSRKHDPPDVTDMPAPTVIAGDSMYWHVDQPVTGFYHDTSGQFCGPDRNQLDETSSTIAGAKNATHYQVVEGEVFDQQTTGNAAFEPTFGPLDQAHPTVLSEGARTSGELRASATGRRRKLTIPELKRICGFPDDYQLTGSFSQQWERLGDAVPPPMSAAWAATLRDGPLAGQAAAALKPARRRRKA